MPTLKDDIHYRWLDTPSHLVRIDEVPNPEPPPHPDPTDPPPTAATTPHKQRDQSGGGSGTAGPDTPEKDQAGSYGRDAEQDPERDRHDRSDADR